MSSTSLFYDTWDGNKDEILKRINCFQGHFLKLIGGVSEIEGTCREVWNAIQSMKNLGPVKYHHVIQIAAFMGLILVEYFNWGDVLDTGCGPHKFFCKVYDDNKLTFQEIQGYFQLLFDK